MPLSISADGNVLILKGNEKKVEEEEATEAGLFTILHMFQGYGALIISIHHTVTHP